MAAPTKRQLEETFPDPTLPTSTAEYEDLAKAKLGPLAWKYVEYQCGEALTAKNSAKFLKRVYLKGRVLKDVSRVDTSIELFGVKYSSPIIAAPTSFQKMVHPDGEIGMARGCQSAGACFVSSGLLGNTHLDDIAKAVPGAGRWLQVYVKEDRTPTINAVKGAKEWGFSAIVVTVDHAHNGVRDIFVPLFESRPDQFPAAGLTLPMLPRPNWHEGADNRPPPSDPTLSWAGIDWLRTITDLPIIVKGVLCVEDAVLACEHGCAGIIISNHGVRQMDSTIPSIEALPMIADAVRGRCKVFLDSNIRTGDDVTKALCLGADAVLVGRPLLWALAVNSDKSVDHCIRMLRHRLFCNMMGLGVNTIPELGRDCLQRRPHYDFL